MALRRQKPGSNQEKKGAPRPHWSGYHPFDWCLACRYGTLAVVMTILYILSILSAPVTYAILTNMAASILSIGIILALILTVKRSRQIIRESV